MRTTTPIRRIYLAMPLLLAMNPAAWGQNAAQTEFQRGYYLQEHDHNLQAAMAAYQQVAENRETPESLRAEARLRMAQAREDLLSADFARLMPPDVLAYAEISNPGENIARLARQVGLIREPDAAATPDPGVTPFGHGIVFPHDFTLSPALIDALESVRGAAVGVTGFDEQGRPAGLLVLNPGDADLIRGLLETAFQFAEPAEPIKGYKTYSLQGEAWVTVTARLFIASRTREALVEAVERLRDPQAPSLATTPDVKSLSAERDGALVFAYINGPRAAQEFRRQVHGNDARIADAVLDLDHLKALVAFVRVTNDGLQMQARLDLMDGNHNLVYALIRTAPCGRAALDYIPSGAAAVAMLGLNPVKSPGPGPESPAEAAAFATAMDIGREVFANLDEATVFASPAASKGEAGGPPIPDVGIVLIAKDAKRSQALWSQLLSIPTMFLPPPAGGVSQITLEGSQATEYRYPDVPPIVLARVKDRAVIIGTRGAAAAALRSSSDGNNITQDAGFKTLLDRLTPSTSKALLVHVGRMTETAAGFSRGSEAQHLSLIASILSNLRVALITDEKPTQCTLRAELTGLPNVQEAVRKFAAARQANPPTEQISQAQP